METKLNWFVCDESNERKGFCCLAVREATSSRLIADLADEPNEYPQCVERSWNEARLLAAAPTLLAACKAVIECHEKQNAPDLALPADLATLAYDAVAQATGTQGNATNAEPEQDFVQGQINIATKALNTLADEYMSCSEILEDTLPTRLDPASEDAVALRMRMATIERYFRSISSNISRYAEV